MVSGGEPKAFAYLLKHCTVHLVLVFIELTIFTRVSVSQDDEEAETTSDKRVDNVPIGVFTRRVEWRVNPEQRIS